MRLRGKLGRIMAHYGFQRDARCFRARWDEDTDIVILDLIHLDADIELPPDNLADPVFGIAIDAHTGETLFDAAGTLAIEWFVNAQVAASYYASLYVLEFHS